MVDFITQATSGPNTQQADASQVPSGTWEGLDWFADTARIGRATSRYIAETGIDPNTGDQITQPEPSLPKDYLNKVYGDPNGAPGLGIKPLAFESDVPESVAQGIAAEHRESIVRADALARAPAGILNGAARFGAQFVAGLLDPLDTASAFMPVVGEARVAGALARAGLDTAGTFAGRTAARLATGAIQGSVGQVPLVALRAALSPQEHDDYTMANALADVFMGGVTGAGLHAAAGGAGDLLGRIFRNTPAARAVDADPQVRETAMRTAVAQMADGRPVDVTNGIELTAAAKAEGELQAWTRAQHAADAETDALLAATETGATPDHATPAAFYEGRLDDLHNDIASLESEVTAAHARSIAGAMDPATADRLSEVQAELGGVIPSARRAALEAEQTMLMEGRGSLDLPTAADQLQQARTQAEIQGLQAQLARQRGRAAETAGIVDSIQTAAERARADAAAQRLASDRLLRIEGAKLASRDQVARALAERTVRRYAASVGAKLEEGEAGAWAAKIIRGEVTPKQSLDAIRGLKREGPARGMVRFYHGAAGAAPDGTPRFVTPDLEYARGYAAKGPHATVYRLDVPEDHPALNKAFDDTGTGNKAPYLSFETPADLSGKFEPHERVSMRDVPDLVDRASAEAGQRLADERQDAARALANSDAAKRAAGADPEGRAVSEQAARTKPLTKEVIARADDEAPPPEETAVAQLEKMLRSQAENDPALKAAFEQLDALAKTREGDAKAVEAAAACILARTI